MDPSTSSPPPPLSARPPPSGRSGFVFAYDEDNRPGLPRPPEPARLVRPRELARAVDLDRRPETLPGLQEPEAEFGFADLLDVINPLQHIPILSHLYRAVTGDEIAGPARVAGGALFGGPIGLVAGMADVVAAEVAGGDLGEIAVAALFGDPPATALAENEAQDPVESETRLAAADPPGPPAELSGEAAIQAFANDLRGLGRAAADELPTVRPTSRPAADPPLDVALHAGSGDEYLLGAAAPKASFTERMLLGLEKYQAMTAAPGAVRSERGQALDDAL